MANEILNSVLSDQRVAAVLSAAYLRMVAERQALPNHPALLYAGDTTGSGSDTITVPVRGLGGRDLPSTVADGDDLTNVAYVDDKVSVTVARYGKQYEPSDLARMLSRGELGYDEFALDTLVANTQLLVSLVAVAGSGFTAQVGATTTACTLAYIDQAVSKATTALAPGPYLVILHPDQWADVRADVRYTSGGQLQTDENIRRLTQGAELGYQGMLDGKTWIFTTTKVPTANSGADYAGSLIAAGGMVWADGQPPVDLPGQQAIIGNKVLLELDRNGTAGLTKFISSTFVGVTRGQQVRGVKILSRVAPS